MNPAAAKQTRILMGMPVTIEISGLNGPEDIFDRVYDYFEFIDNKFSTYKPLSEISLLNQGELSLDETSPEMATVFELSEQWRHLTGGYFDIYREGKYDPSGLVKGWAISNAAEILRNAGCENYYVEAGGDIQVAGKNPVGQNWRVGIRNPFDMNEIVKVLSLTDCGVATSGTYIRGQHIYDPVSDELAGSQVVSLTVIGPDIYEADCIATAAFAMGREGIRWIETLEGFEGYSIDMDKVATFTTGFERYVAYASLD